jgi:hypothetical protein
MKQSPREADSRLASQELLGLLCNPKVHYHVHNSPSLIIILNQINLIHNLQPYLFNIYLNIILPSAPKVTDTNKGGWRRYIHMASAVRLK